MGQPRSAAECARIEKPSGATAPGALAGCAGGHKAIASHPAPDAWVEGSNGQGAITVIDDSWGVPGLGTDGTLALGGMAIAAATVTIIAWRALTPMRPARR